MISDSRRQFIIWLLFSKSINIARVLFFIESYIRHYFLNTSPYINFVQKVLNSKFNVFNFDIKNELACPIVLYDGWKGRRKEQSRNIISGSDGKIIAASTVGLTVGDWNFSLVRHPPESRRHQHMYTRARVNAKHPNVHVPNEFTFTLKLRQNINDGPLMAFPFDVREKRAAARRESSRLSWNSPQSPRQFVVIHIRLGLPLAPSSCHLVGIGQLEFAIGSFPRDARGVTRVRQKLE